MDKRIYRESQRLDSIWPISILTITIVIHWFSYFKMGNQDLTTIYISFLGSLILCMLLSWLRLQVEIDEDEIRYKMRPFHFKWQILTKKDIKHTEVRSYRPIKEFGGWGIRYSKNGKAYTLGGNIGLQVCLKTGQNILLGTLNPETLSAFLKEAGYLHL